MTNANTTPGTDAAETIPFLWDAIPVDTASNATPLPQATDLPELIALPRRAKTAESRPVRLSAEQSDVGFGIDQGLEAA
jgi:hypothetical protein